MKMSNTIKENILGLVLVQPRKKIVYWDIKNQIKQTNFKENEFSVIDLKCDTVIPVGKYCLASE